MSKMLYKIPESGKGAYFLHKIWVDYKVIDEKDLDVYLNGGWSETPLKAKEAYEEGLKEDKTIISEPNPDFMVDDGEEEQPEEELDSEGQKWDPDLHTSPPAKIAAGTWRKKPNRNS